MASVVIVCVLCISLDGGILRPVSVLYYLTVDKAETSCRPPPHGYTLLRNDKMSWQKRRVACRLVLRYGSAMRRFCSSRRPACRLSLSRLVGSVPRSSLRSCVSSCVLSLRSVFTCRRARCFLVLLLVLFLLVDTYSLMPCPCLYHFLYHLRENELTKTAHR